jgi:hypothetical protein
MWTISQPPSFLPAAFNNGANMHKKLLAAAALIVAGGLSAQTPAPAPAPATMPRTASPAGAKLYIVAPASGATVKSPVTVVFGLSGMGIAPAGVQFENAGHHHLLIDAAVPANLGLPLPATDNIKHFGKGQTEASIELKPGTHTLQLVLGDHNHIPFNPVVASAQITITVQ